MKTTLILLLTLPLMTLADIAPTPTYYRYQRIGFEVLPNASAQSGTLTETPFCIRQLETERIIKAMSQ